MKTNMTFKSSCLGLCILITVIACKKDTIEDNTIVVDPLYPGKTDSVYSPKDPGTAPTFGFFANGWIPRTFVVPDTVRGTVPAIAATDSLLIDANQVITKVSPYVYGNNSNLWTGQYTSQPSLMQYLKDLTPNIIRAPAGSVSDVYFFNGVDTAPAPKDVPKQLLNAGGTGSDATWWYGGNNADWTLSLSNYYKMLTQVNSTGVITVNYGYARYGTSANPVAAAAHLAADWVRFDKGRTKYWEIGNENHGNWEAGYRIDKSLNKDGQPEIITGALYGQHVKVFADSMRAAAKETGATIYIGAILYEQPAASFDDNTTKTWNQGVLAQAGNTPDFFIVHSYFTPYLANSTPTEILNSSTAIPASIMSYIKQQITAAGVTIKPIAMTEWNIRASGSKQNVSYVAGMHVAKTLGAIIKNQFGEASRWDIANGYENGDDHGLFSNGDEPGTPKWNPRPAYFYQYYFQKFFGDRMVADTLRAVNKDLTTYSSTFSSGQVGAVIVNSGTYNHVLSIDIQHFPAGKKYYWYVLTGGTDNGSFSGQVYVNGTGPSTPTGGPLGYASLKAFSAPLSGTMKVSVPAMSVVYVVADKK